MTRNVFIPSIINTNGYGIKTYFIEINLAVANFAYLAQYILRVLRSFIKLGIRLIFSASIMQNITVKTFDFYGKCRCQGRLKIE